jgi:Tfp pilus assembly protein PilV
VLRLTQDASLRSSIAQAGREAVEESFAREKQDARLAANYKELMTAAASRR